MFKRMLGCGLMMTAAALPAAKPWLCRWGRRTRQEWFGRRVVWTQSRQGLRLKLASLGKNYLSFELFWRGLDYYEPLTAWLTGELAVDGGRFLDVGANIGFHSLMLAARRPAVRIVAFEANPRVHRLLKANVDANRFSQITCEGLALSDTSGRAPLFLSESDMSASLDRGFSDPGAGVVVVATTTLDAYAARRSWSGPLLIKVDVEGHEAAFFAGAQATLAAHHPDIIAEAAVPYTLETLASLTGHGYRFYSISDAGLIRSAAPAPVVRPPLVFLNNLLTTRPADEVARLSDRLRVQASRIDFLATSKRADRKVLERLRAWPAPPQAVRS